MVVRGLNHITLAVTDLDRSLSFYNSLLGFERIRKWENGAYLSAGQLWLCLSLDADAKPAEGYTHIALDVGPEEYSPLVEKLNSAGHPSWKTNESEGDSYYFSDPDGHRLELHVGSLESRMAHYRSIENKEVEKC